jgi:hypothetical protein
MAKGTLRSRVPVFREHLRRGLTAGEAGVAVGVSPDCGQRWFREAGVVKPRCGAGQIPRLGGRGQADSVD